MTKNRGRVRARKSEHINRRVTQSIFRAFDYASHIGTPLNTYAVLILHETSAASAATIFERVRHKFRDWLTYAMRRLGLDAAPPSYVFTLETIGKMHVNWVVHVPDPLKPEFARKLKTWVRKSQGVCGPRDAYEQPVAVSYAKHLAKYVVKGTDPVYVPHFHLEKHAAPQGTIYGKRAGVSPSLGPTVRREAGFRPGRRRYGDDRCGRCRARLVED